MSWNDGAPADDWDDGPKASNSNFEDGFAAGGGGGFDDAPAAGEEHTADGGDGGGDGGACRK